MRIADRRWRFLALALVLGGSALTFMKAFGLGIAPIAGIDPEVVGFILIVAGLVLFFPSQRAATRAEEAKGRSIDGQSGTRPF